MRGACGRTPRATEVRQPGSMIPIPRTSPIALVRAAELTHSTRSIRRGEVVPVLRGVYAETGDWQSLPRWERDLARVHAHLLRDPDAVLCLESAALLWGLPTLGAIETVHVLADDTATSRRVSGIRVHTSAHSDRVIDEIGGIRLTSPAETCVDIARTRHPAAGLVLADATLRRDATMTAAALAALNEQRASARGRRHARWALERADAAAESPLESTSRAGIEWWGFPTPELQHWIGPWDDDGDRTDMWWPAIGLVGEADGHLKYDGRFGDPVAALRAREERDRRLRRRGARAVAHWAWDDLADPSALRDILLSAGLSPDRPPDLNRPAGLRRLLRPGLPSATPPP